MRRRDYRDRCQDPATRPQTGSTVKTFPETPANPNIWVYSGGLPKFRQFLIFCFQSAVLLPGLEITPFPYAGAAFRKFCPSMQMRVCTGFVLRQADACGIVSCQYRHVKVASRHGHEVEATSTWPPAPVHLESRARGQLHRSRGLGVDRHP